MTALHLIRDRFMAQIQQAAQELEQHVASTTLDSIAYQQGRRDERARILAHLQTWREQIPPDRALAPTRNALTTIIRTLEHR
jgi:hypothetical protein